LPCEFVDVIFRPVGLNTRIYHARIADKGHMRMVPPEAWSAK
jgi:hypothetical protein